MAKKIKKTYTVGDRTFVTYAEAYAEAVAHCEQVVALASARGALFAAFDIKSKPVVDIAKKPGK